jgi:hypothetical protein
MNLEALGLARIWTREHFRFDPAGDTTAPVETADPTTIAR